MAGFTAFEVGNVAATLLILRATDILIPGHGVDAATQIAIALYVIYNVAATITSFPAGGLSDKLGQRGPLLVTAAGVAAFLVAYLMFATSGPLVLVLGVAFALAGVGIGCAETAEHAAVAAFALPRSAGPRSGCWPPCKPWAMSPPAPSRACSTPSSRPRWRSSTSGRGCSSLWRCSLGLRARRPSMHPGPDSRW